MTPRPPAPDYDAIVVGAGHNGLVTAAYLARAGLRIALLEARDTVGGTAGSDRFAGATVNVCSCDHLTFRTTPVSDELDLGRFGLRYLPVDPAHVGLAWSGGPAWAQWHDLDRTLDGLARTFSDEVDGYRRYVRAALPAIEMVFAAAVEPPTVAGLTRLAARRRLSGAPTLLRWSRRSAADVMRGFFRHDALIGVGLAAGPMVWGISPEQPGSGLGALGFAMRHVAEVGRPAGGSGMLPASLLAAFEHHGGELHAKAEVAAIRCNGGGVRAVELADGTELVAPVVVVACDPRRALVEWLRHAPAGAASLVERWRRRPHHAGYESKIDAVMTDVPALLDADLDPHPGSTLTLAPSVIDMHRAATLLHTGEVLERPLMFVNVPSVLDPSLAPPGRHVFSLEVLFTPYRLGGGWAGSAEPARWLDVLAERLAPGFRESIVAWRAMTPDVYERDFHLPAGHAASFAGGPLAAFRTPDPELTRYETAIPGLYLTGAATFPGAGIWGASGRNCATVVLAVIG